MPPFCKDAATRVLESLDLETANRALALYWLSLWEGDALPRRNALSPARLKPYLPHILLFDTVPEKSVTIRLAGTRFRLVLGTELTGCDWIALAPPSYRSERLRIISAIARGAVGVGHRRVALAHGDDVLCEEILLPFAAEDGGVSPVLVHANWRAEGYARVRAPAVAMGDPLDFRLCALVA